jgi:hypothetical protein
MKADGNLATAVINATTVATGSASTITIDSVANVTGTKTNHLIGYTGSSPFAGLSLAPMPSGYTGSLQDSGTSIDLVFSVAVSTPPTIHSIAISGGQVIISGTNNAGSGGTYSLLSATNVVTPLSNWIVLSSGSFDGSGNFSITNSTGTNAQRFYILRVP